MSQMIPNERIENRIYWIRGQKVLLDADLAELYGVPTKALNQAVKRNKDRFPNDFMFQINAEEKLELVTICDRFTSLKHSTSFPYAFTEHGTLMLANVLRSDRAIHISIEIVRTFVRLREILATHTDLARKLTALESKYDDQFKAIFDAIRELMKPPVPPRREIGFNRE